MNTLRNSVQLLGNVGKDVELITLDGGRQLAKTSLATNEFYTDKNGEKQNKTEWHNLVLWGKAAERFANSIEKGSSVLVKGKIEYKSYDDKEGNTKYVTDIIVREFAAMTKKEAAEMPF